MSQERAAGKPRAPGSWGGSVASRRRRIEVRRDAEGFGARQHECGRRDWSRGRRRMQSRRHAQRFGPWQHELRRRFRRRPAHHGGRLLLWIVDSLPARRLLHRQRRLRSAHRLRLVLLYWHSGHRIRRKSADRRSASDRRSGRARSARYDAQPNESACNDQSAPTRVLAHRVYPSRRTWCWHRHPARATGGL